MRENKHYLFYWILIILINMMISSCFYFSANVISFFVFVFVFIVAAYNYTVYMYHIFSIHSSLVRHWGLSYLQFYKALPHWFPQWSFTFTYLTVVNKRVLSPPILNRVSFPFKLFYVYMCFLAAVFVCHVCMTIEARRVCQIWSYR